MGRANFVRPDSGLAEPLDVVIVCALDFEAAPIIGSLRKHREIKAHRFTMAMGLWHRVRCAVIQAPTGRKGLMEAVSAVLDVHRPTWVVAAGCAASLSDQVHNGDIVLANELVEDSAAGERIPLAVLQELSGRKLCHVGRIISMPRLPRLASRRRELGQASGTLAVDQQSFAIGKVCAARNVKLLVARIIVEDLTADSRPESIAVYHPSTSYRAGGYVGALLHGAGHVGTIWRIRQSAQRSARRLATFLSQFVRLLETTGH